MNTADPKKSTFPTGSVSSGPFSNRALWMAYAFAPSVAPLSLLLIFAAFVFLFPVDENDTGTPAGLILIPFIILTVGVLASYAVAGAIGMPIAFFLRRRGQLNGRTIHLAALIWSFVFVFFGLSGVLFLSTSPKPNLSELLAGLGITWLIIAPCILLSATTFWWILNHNQISLKWFFVLTAGIGIVLAVAIAIARSI